MLQNHLNIHGHMVTYYNTNQCFFQEKLSWDHKLESIVITIENDTWDKVLPELKEDLKKYFTGTGSYHPLKTNRDFKSLYGKKYQSCKAFALDLLMFIKRYLNENEEV